MRRFHLSRRLGRLAFSTVLAAAWIARADGPASPASADPVISQIREEGLNHSHVPETLDYLCNVIGGRLTGSPAQSRASVWTRDTLAGWGMVDAHLEPWGPFGRGWALQQYSLQVTEPYAIILHGFPKAWSPGFDEPLAADLVYLDAKNKGELSKYAGTLKGKFVMIGRPRTLDAHFAPEAVRMTDAELAKLAAAPAGHSKVELLAPTTAPTTGLATAPSTRATATTRPSKLVEMAAAAFATEEFNFAAREGASVIIDASPKGDDGTIFVAGANVPTLSQTSTTGPTTNATTRPAKLKVYALDTPPVPSQITLATEDFNRLVHMVRQNQAIKLSLTLHVKFYPPSETTIANTIAEIPGSDLKDEVVMIGGHLDSWHSGTGATDNAAGAASAMEAIRIIRSLNLHPRRTIRIALWTGEEEGLLGSTAYVKQHFGYFPDLPEATTQPTTRPLRELVESNEYEKLSVYFNLDNGTGKIRGICTQGNTAGAAVFRQWIAPFADLDAKTVTLANSGGTDHISFDRIGLPGFEFMQDSIEYNNRTHHSNMDVYDRLQLDDLKQASTIMAAFLWDAANAVDRFPRKSVE